MLEFIQQKCYK